MAEPYTKKLFSLLIMFALVFTLSFPETSRAQQGGGSGGDSDLVNKSVSDMVTVASLGVAGAVLGLSTLSFVDEPEDHLKNIVVGGSLGIIAGVGVVAYQQANQSQQYYQQQVRSRANPEFSTSERLAWHRLSTENIEKVPFSQIETLEEAPALTYQFSF